MYDDNNRSRKVSDDFIKVAAVVTGTMAGLGALVVAGGAVAIQYEQGPVSGVYDKIAAHFEREGNDLSRRLKDESVCAYEKPGAEKTLEFHYGSNGRSYNYEHMLSLIPGSGARIVTRPVASFPEYETAPCAIMLEPLRITASTLSGKMEAARLAAVADPRFTGVRNEIAREGHIGVFRNPLSGRSGF